MSSETITTSDPFDISALDEETELRALAQALRFADRFALIFARCNQPQQRKRLVEELRKQLPQLNIQEIHFTGPITHLLDALRESITEPRPDAIFVSGLEYSLPTAADAHATPFVANLNAARNSFPQVVPCPLVLWVPEYVLTAIVRGAPDFFSIRSGVYFFAIAPEDSTEFAGYLTTGTYWAAQSLTAAEKQERISAIESLLADYELLPPGQRDCRVEMGLHARLGSLLQTLGAYSAAQKHFEQSLKLAQELGDRRWEEIQLIALGSSCLYQRKLDEAEELYEQSLAIAQKLGDQINETGVLINLASIYREKKQFEEAEKAYKRGLAIAEEIGNQQIKGLALQGLGMIYYGQGRLEEAEKAFQESLAITRKIGDRVSAAWALNTLASVYYKQGRLEEAEEAYQQSLATSHEIDDRVQSGVTNLNLAHLRMKEGNISEALDYARSAAAILEKTEGKQLLEDAQALVTTIEDLMEKQETHLR